MKYVLAIDQSTQGTKALVFDENLAVVSKAYLTHRQIIDKNGYVSHDGEEIFQNVSAVVKQATDSVPKDDIVCVGLCNQRETTVIWGEDGKPLNDIVVWQCGRAAGCIEPLKPYAKMIKEKTGLPLSPYFSAAKMGWLINNTPNLPEKYFLGTIDSYLIFRLTEGKKFVTDISNACRTQLFNIHTLQWDEKLCELFSIPRSSLPQVIANDGDFGETDFNGILPEKIPVRACFGDSQGALFAQNCRRAGTVKSTYGTGSSVMMNVGGQPVESSCGLACSIAWKINNEINYVSEGNINYTGAVVSWLKDDLRLIGDVSELEGLIDRANADDKTLLIPAFSGLSAPFWHSEIPAVFYGMSRTTRKEELVKAAVESIAYQINAVLDAMKKDTNQPISVLRADGAPTQNKFLMALQSNLLGSPVEVSTLNELSAAGAAILAGMKSGVYGESIFDNIKYCYYKPEQFSDKKYNKWLNLISLLQNIRI